MRLELFHQLEIVRQRLISRDNKLQMPVRIVDIIVMTRISKIMVRLVFEINLAVKELKIIYNLLDIGQ